jgi:hypothetical protein
MEAWGRLAAVGLAVLLGVAVLGCASRSGGMVQETSEFTFDDIAAAAAAETAESENPLE